MTMTEKPNEPPAGGACLPFVNKDGRIIRLARSMTLRELLNIGVVEIHIAKPGTPLREGEWRDASHNAQRSGALNRKSHE